ncbi:MAG: tetratricopeptide repeat protein [Mediterranea sp.]|jgi:tetratricopeptide (TPR) repeat protein|nr:tetratricopeptide repeat protein [Mediterranea sp.]
MIDEKTLNEQYKYISSLLEEKRLKEALAQLEALLWQFPDWDSRTMLERLQTSYDFMLEYMKQGVDDPSRPDLYRKLLVDAWSLADYIRALSLTTSSSKYYFFSRRLLGVTPVTEKEGMIGARERLMEFAEEAKTLDELPEEERYRLLDRHDFTLKLLFLRTWTGSQWGEDEEAAARALLTSETIRGEDLCIYVSALMLSLMEFFDLRRFAVLLDTYRDSRVGVSQRALVGVIIIAHIYRKRMPLYPDLLSKISLMDDELPALRRDVGCVYRQLLLSQETEKIEKRMREEIIPEMMKTVSSMKNMRFGSEEGDEEDDFNPDWSNAFEQAGLEDKMRELTDLQMEGADVFMSTFAALKNFPFFDDMNNWFYPFTRLQSDIYKKLSDSEIGKIPMLNVISDSSLFNNSDKYSFFFSVLGMPKAQQMLLLNQISEESGMDLMEDLEQIKKYARQANNVSNQYLHDLYRFFKLFAKKADFRDIFEEKFDLYHVPGLSGMLFNRETLYSICDFYLKKEHWIEAVEIYEEMERVGILGAEDAEAFQKWGYALQRGKRYQEAIHAYQRSDTLCPDNVWNNRRLATCYRLTKQYTTALSYYNKVSEVVPNDAGIVFHIATCQAELGNYAEALNTFFKLDFMRPDNVKAWRGIGWCSFVSQKYEQATRYYEKILELKPLPIDYMNAGHVAWVMGDIVRAAELYGKAVATGGGKRATFVEMFDKDVPSLLKLGIREEDIPLMLDLI